ncbi:hypothetical protein EKO04_009875 [Ascochyta lentis]|uniref:Aminoglycoside phosphotransferase domain-containing protein n=1 Tax=Ascochyta lentis TaxID=205686 RepID=A0A8H7IT61_9PLEO|nr:hypothetical protein EKO04_009875 [Ascochyta lentis]
MLKQLMGWFLPTSAHKRSKQVTSNRTKPTDISNTQNSPSQDESTSTSLNDRKSSIIKGWCDRLKAKYKNRETSVADEDSTDYSTNGTTVTNNSEYEEDEDHPRCDWKTIDAIPASSYEKLVSHTCTFSGPLKQLKRFAYKKGTYNAVSFIGVLTRDKYDSYVVRVPGHATVEHWTAQDAYMLEREVQTIEYIRKNTSVPVPQIYSHSSWFNNRLHHPFIMMKRLPGKSAYSIWFDDDFGEADPEVNFRFGDLPSHAVEKKRINFLRSLARIMTEINALSFDQIGIPVIPLDCSAPPSIGHTYHWDNTSSDVSTKRPALSSTRDLIRTRPDSLCTPSLFSNDSKAHNRLLGTLKLLDIIFSQPIFHPTPSAPETFTLHHADLDLQNILVDDMGNITGIIDWDRCTTAPRCIGASSAPLFLQKDWMPQYLNNLDTSPYMAFTTHRYRQMYAAALAEQGCADAQFTSKSAMYQAGVLALMDHEGGNVTDFLEKVMRSIPQFRADVDECLVALGMGWPAGEQVLEKEVRKLFEPEMPDMDVLREADVEIAVVEWMLAFEYGIE